MDFTWHLLHNSHNKVASNVTPCIIIWCHFSSFLTEFRLFFNTHSDSTFCYHSHFKNFGICWWELIQWKKNYHKFIRLFQLSVVEFHDVDMFCHSALSHKQMFRGSAILFSSHFVSRNNCVFVFNNYTQRAVHTVLLRLRFFLSQHIGCMGFNVTAHRMRLRQWHQILFNPLVAINKSVTIAPCV